MSVKSALQTLEQMSDKSERAYWWIDDKTQRASRWLGKNIGRILFAVGAAGVSAYGYQQPSDTFIRSISPELFGIVLTAVIIDYVNELRQDKERKKILIAQLSSVRRDVTELAIIELKNRGWLYDGSLRGATLWDADLSGAILMDVNLSGVYLRGVDLSRAYLQRVNLSRAYLQRVNLSRAYLQRANLSRADLGNANLSGADLQEANLSRAGLWQADLSEARFWTIEQLEQAELLKGTILPDGVQLGQEGAEYGKHIDGPTFEEWKAQYLSEHGGTVTDKRNTKRARR